MCWDLSSPAWWLTRDLTICRFSRSLSHCAVAIFSLDPYWFRAVTEKINKPGMYWGFTEASCLVDVEKAAR